MASLPATLIRLLSAASPILVLGSVIPESSRGSVPCRDGSAGECLAEPSPCDAEEDSSLLQVRRASGCPNSFAWSAIETVAKTLFSSKIADQLPFEANHTFLDQSFNHSGCSGTVTGLAKMSIDADFRLDAMKCVSATCTVHSWFGCTEYSPIQISVSLSASTLAFKAFLDGSASWGSGCPDGAGSAKMVDDTMSFTVTNPALAGAGTVDLVVAFPPQISDPSISSVSISYGDIGDVECSMDGHPFVACIDAMDYLNTDEFKQGLAKASSTALKNINEGLAKQLENTGVSLLQLFNGEAEFHPSE